MASTICVEESIRRVEYGFRRAESASCQGLPTRLSTKLTFRSLWRVRTGGRPDLVTALLEVRLGFWRSSRGTSTAVCSCVWCIHEAVALTWSQDTSGAWKEVEGCEWQYESHGSDELEVGAVRVVSSESWEEASDQTDAVEDEAEEAREVW